MNTEMTTRRRAGGWTERWMAIGLCAVLLAGCATSPDPDKMTLALPDWVQGETPDWPRSRYLLGVGSGADQATAEEAARAEIARTFAVEVRAVTGYTQSETRSGGAAGPSSSFQSDAYNRVSSSAHKALEGVEIVRRSCRKDDAGTVCHALAVLDKARALRTLRERGDAIEALAQNLQPQLASRDGFEAGWAAARLAALSGQMARLQADARILGGSAGGLFDFAGARSAMEAALKRMQLAVVVDVDAALAKSMDASTTRKAADAAAVGLLEALNEAGFAPRRYPDAAAAHAGAGVDLLVWAQVGAGPQPSGDPAWQRYAAQATVVLKTRNGQEWAAWTSAVREDATNAVLAERRGLDKFSAAVAAQARKALAEKAAATAP